jgi:hypothetical protein
VLAYDYPLLGIFWSMLAFFLFFLWVWLVILVFADIFRSDDLSGWGKALWILLVVLVPLLGVVIYFIARGGSMNQRGRGGSATTGVAPPTGMYPYMTWR